MQRRAPSRSAAAIAALVVATVLAAGCVAPPSPPPPARAVKFDFDGDRKADIAWITTDGFWYRAGASTPFFSSGSTVDFGKYEPSNGDLPVPGNYDGDGRWDAAIVRNRSDWITASPAGTIVFPAPPETDLAPSYPPRRIIPVPADYDGDGRSDPAWYRETDATWWIAGSASPISFGRPYNNHGDKDYDIPVPGDYDGDGRDEIATFDPSNGNFTIRGRVDPVATGPMAGTPAPADYDGDGDDDPAELHNTGVEPDVPIYLPPGSGMINPAVPGATYFIHDQNSVQPFPPELRYSSTAVPLPRDYSGAGRAQAGALSSMNGDNGPWAIDGAVATSLTSGRPVMPSWQWLSEYRLAITLRCHYGPQAGTC